MEHIFLSARHHGVASVIPPLEANDTVRPLAEDIDNLSFSLVPPLGSDDNISRHKNASFSNLDVKRSVEPVRQASLCALPAGGQYIR